MRISWACWHSISCNCEQQPEEQTFKCSKPKCLLKNIYIYILFFIFYFFNKSWFCLHCVWIPSPLPLTSGLLNKTRTPSIPHYSPCLKHYHHVNLYINVVSDYCIQWWYLLLWAVVANVWHCPITAPWWQRGNRTLKSLNLDSQIFIPVVCQFTTALSITLRPYFIQESRGCVMWN